MYQNANTRNLSRIVDLSKNSNGEDGKPVANGIVINAANGNVDNTYKSLKGLINNSNTKAEAAKAGDSAYCIIS